MYKRIISAALMLAASVAFAAPVGIASGNTTGTNHPMAEDIKNTCSTKDSPISNGITAGSIENLYKVFEDKNFQYGIVQADAAEYQKGVDPKMMDRILMVFPFFSVEMHLAAKHNSPIKSLNDLQGRRVVEGPKGSGTWVTVQVIKALTGIKWQPIEAKQQEGFDMVMNGQADAEFVVAGKPIDLFTKSKGYKLIPLSHPALDKFGLYTKTTIFPIYDAVPYPVETYKVDNMLVTYAFTNQYQKEIGELVSCITRNMGKLQATGHAKWKDVNPLDIDRIKWPTHPAAVSAIKREAAKLPKR